MATTFRRQLADVNHRGSRYRRDGGNTFRPQHFHKSLISDRLEVSQDPRTRLTVGPKYRLCGDEHIHHECHWTMFIPTPCFQQLIVYLISSD